MSRADVLSLRRAATAATSQRITEDANAVKASLERAQTGVMQSQRIKNHLNNFRTVVDTVTKPFQILARFFFDGRSPIAHYVAIGLVILLIVGFFTFSLPRFRWIRLPRISYRMRLTGRMFTPFKGAPTGVQRPQVIGGRCDQTAWREVGAGPNGMCARTTVPPPVKWVMDPDKLPEISKLPKTLVQRVTNDQRKWQVEIPWVLKGTFYLPNCKAARFGDGTSAAHLFEDDGTTCRLAERPSTAYKGEAYRPKLNSEWYKGVDGYASASNPKCA
jgi:hypothetical protein